MTGGNAPTIISALAFCASTGLLWITWLQHQHAKRTGYVGELRGEIDLIKSQAARAKEMVEDQAAIIKGQRKEIAELTLANAKCEGENAKLSARVTQLEGDVRHLTQLAESARRGGDRREKALD